jgi:hypothetical protein
MTPIKAAADPSYTPVEDHIKALVDDLHIHGVRLIVEGLDLCWSRVIGNPEVLHAIADRLALPQPREAEPVGTCDCGFAPDICATNSCLRKKIHLAGLTPGSKWPNTASPSPIPDAPGGRESAALAAAEASFEFIRLTLIDFLEEPARSAFWRAVEARNALLALKPQDGGSVVANEDISTNPAPRLHAFKPKDGGESGR